MDKTNMTMHTYDNIADKYLEYILTIRPKGEVVYRAETDYLISKINNDNIILDVGCAVGNYGKYILDNYHNGKLDIIGIDSSGNMLNLARQMEPRAKYILGDIRKLDLLPNSCDIIFSFALLIHFDDKDCINIIKKLDSALKHNGMLAINVMKYIDKESEIITEPFDVRYKTYFNYYRKDFFIDLLENNLENKYKLIKSFDNEIAVGKDMGELDNGEFTLIFRKL